MNIGAVVVAAGRGARSGLDRNKVLYDLKGKTVLVRCLEALAAGNILSSIIVVVAESEQSEIDALLKATYEGSCPVKTVIGGATRADSVRNGLNALPEDTEIVAIHDAARPFVTEAILKATVDAAIETGSGVIATDVVDTIKQIAPDGTVTTPARSSLRAVQTPQTFRLSKIVKAHNYAVEHGLSITDDASAYEACFGSVTLVTAEGAEKNIKLTKPEDFRRLKGNTMRVGIGYDAHRLKEGRKLILCGVDVPHTRGLDGHSDADVAVHALMDALLGALDEGDIGRHFPDSDPAYKGISSMKLLDHVMGIVEKHGMKVENADVTIVAQKPKLAAFIPTMKANLEAALNASCVNVKATTTEHMGFEGEEIGISAQAAVLLSER
ncbi:MAG: 2-C-methyl-D-erythritol 4-phosphate cytidylyltransferase [Clostridia bacterium]|nr:2-C-methyl-D-erythritol 4-phosphate cytidylyltransferase [Clostridia bacterium]